MKYRLLPLTFALLLASCAQSPVVEQPEPTPAVPTFMSTEFSDRATRVITAEDGGAYVLGYRHEMPEDAGETELFASRFDAAGKLQWLTVLPGDGLPESTPNLALSGAFVGGNLYISTLTQSSSSVEAKPLTLHKLEPKGKLLWSRNVFTVNGASDLVAAPNGQLYLRHSSYTSDNSAVEEFLTALSSKGEILWEREERGTPLAAASEGSVYVDGFRSLRKYGVDGTLLWSQALAPSVPGFSEVSAPEAGPFSDITVRDDGFYLTMTYLYDTPNGPENAAWNTEVRRYAADGTQIWTKVVFAPETGATRVANLPIGAKTDGSLIVLQADIATPDLEARSAQILRLSPEGELSTVGLSGTTLDTLLDAQGIFSVNDVALTSATVEGSVRDAFYAVGATGSPPCQGEPCPLSDAYLSLYTLVETEGDDEAETSLLWSAR